MENNENNVQNNEQINTAIQQQDEPVAKELAKPQKKRKVPLSISAIFTVIGAIVFGFYLLYLLSTYQLIISGDATGLLAIFLLPLCILIGLVAIALNIVGLINAIISIHSDISKVKIWGIILTVLTALMITATCAIFFILIH